MPNRYQNVIVAATVTDGESFMRAGGARGTVVTPRTLDRLRGLTVGRAIFTPSSALLARHDRDKIEAALTPCLVTLDGLHRKFALDTIKRWQRVADLESGDSGRAS